MVLALGILGSLTAWVLVKSPPSRLWMGTGAGDAPAALSERREQSDSGESRNQPRVETRVEAEADQPFVSGLSRFQVLRRPTTAPDGAVIGSGAALGQRAFPALVPPTTGTVAGTAAVAPLMVPQPEIPVPAEAQTTGDGMGAVQPPLVFSDLPEDHWAKGYIDGLTARGILAGFPDGTYGPDQPLTRAQFAAQLAQAFDTLPSQRAPLSFQDLAADYWAETSINQTVAQGFMSGYPGGVFQPEETVPRVQVMAAIAAGLQMPVQSRPEIILQAHPDQEQVPAWARQQAASAIAANLVNPEPGRPLAPNRPATRAEVAAMLYQALVYLGEVPPLD